MINKITPLSTERIEELLQLSHSICHAISNNPKDGYQGFLTAWEKWSQQEKELVRPKIKNSLQFYAKSGDAYIFPLREMICNAIINYMDDDLNNKTVTPKLTKGNNFSQKQFAKLFYDVKIKGAIINGNKQIALAISNVFDFNYDTILHYLKNPSEFEGVPDILST